MSTDSTPLTPFERLLSLFTPIHAGEGRSVVYFFLNSFLLLVSYYLLKPVREALILTEGSAEVRSYAVAAQAVLILIAIPLYGILFRNTNRLQLLRWVIFLFAANLLVFCALGMAHVRIGVFFFIWLGIFSVTLVAQFWAFAADVYSVEAGHRLFAIIAVGATLGALVGSEASKALIAGLGPYGLMLASAVILAATVILSRLADRSVPPTSRGIATHRADADASRNLLGGIVIVFKDRYLLLIAGFVLLLNCINSTGEFILARVAVEYAEGLVAASSGSLSKGAAIGAFYGSYYFWVNLLTFLFQIFLVHRIYRLIGVHGALLISPIVAFIAYGLIAIIPIFTIIRLAKILENSTDYSIQNTTRHALFLPASRTEKYQGKTAIDTFFWRLGDLIQAGVVYVGLNVLGFGMAHFAAVNCALAGIWLVLAVTIGAHHKRRVAGTGKADSAPVTEKAGMHSIAGKVL